MSRVLTIIAAHFKSWYRSRSNIFWTIAFPLLLIVLFGAIFGNGSTKFDLYVQNRDLAAATPTMLSANYVSTLNGRELSTFTSSLRSSSRPWILSRTMPESTIVDKDY